MQVWLIVFFMDLDELCGAAELAVVRQPER